MNISTFLYRVWMVFLSKANRENKCVAPIPIIHKFKDPGIRFKN